MPCADAPPALMIAPAMSASIVIFLMNPPDVFSATLSVPEKFHFPRRTSSQPCEHKPYPPARRLGGVWCGASRVATR